MSANTTLCANVMCANSGKMNNLKLESSSDGGTDAVTGTPLLTLTNTHADGNGPILKLKNDPAATGTSDNDIVGQIVFEGDDDAEAVETYGKIVCTQTDNAAAGPDAKMELSVDAAGTASVGLALTSSGSAGVVNATVGLGATSTVTIPATISMGAKKFSSFGITLAGTTAGAIGAGEVIVFIGSLDATTAPGLQTATGIVIERVILMIQTASANAEGASIHMGSSASDAENAAVTGGVEVVGAGVNYIIEPTSDGTLQEGGPMAAQSTTEIDFALATAAGSMLVARPGITVPVAKPHMYLTAGDNTLADVTAFRGNICVEYLVF